MVGMNAKSRVNAPRKRRIGTTRGQVERSGVALKKVARAADRRLNDLPAVYRSVQEGVTNAIRHGKADTVKVELFEKRGKHNGNGNGDASKPTLQLLIQDDGRGILPETALGFGLTVMRERVNALGGSCAIQSAPSHGATLRVVIPINAVAAVQRRPIEKIEAN